MRRAGWDSGWHLDQHGEVIGFSLHGDACTEHEVGISEFKEELGLPKAFENGLADRVNTRIPASFRFETYDDHGEPAALLLISSHARFNEGEPATPHYMASETSFRTGFGGRGSEREQQEARHRERFAGAWDSSGFLLRVKGKGYVDRLAKMAKALETHDLALGGYLIEDKRDRKPGEAPVGGLTLVRASRVNPELAEKLLAKDQSDARLRAAANEVLPGLTSTLKASGKLWFALTPRWKDDTERELTFWLNPYEQSDHHAGFFTEDELRAWARNEGPVMIDKDLVRRERQLSPLFQRVSKTIDQAKEASMLLSLQRSADDPTQFVVKARRWDTSSKPERLLPEGEYTVSDLEERFPMPVRAPRQRRR